ncbi:Uncharacterized protein HZ326_20667 [Fusarium oxysporum f. sp. albedinis]|nr:Uncharacterized protein HZ326_20667 [Fusarium oxysporum f. sp. albedinis]
MVDVKQPTCCTATLFIMYEDDACRDILAELCGGSINRIRIFWVNSAHGSVTVSTNYPTTPFSGVSLIRRDKEVEPDTSGQHHIHGQPGKSRRTHFGELQINIHKLKLCQFKHHD